MTARTVGQLRSGAVAPRAATVGKTEEALARLSATPPQRAVDRLREEVHQYPVGGGKRRGGDHQNRRAAAQRSGCTPSGHDPQNPGCTAPAPPQDPHDARAAGTGAGGDSCPLPRGRGPAHRPEPRHRSRLPGRCPRRASPGRAEAGLQAGACRVGPRLTPSHFGDLGGRTPGSQASCGCGNWGCRATQGGNGATLEPNTIPPISAERETGFEPATFSLASREAAALCRRDQRRRHFVSTYQVAARSGHSYRQFDPETRPAEPGSRKTP